MRSNYRARNNNLRVKMTQKEIHERNRKILDQVVEEVTIFGVLHMLTDICYERADKIGIGKDTTETWLNRARKISILKVSL